MSGSTEPVSNPESPPPTMARRVHPSWVRHPASGLMRLGVRLLHCCATTRHTKTALAVDTVAAGDRQAMHPSNLTQDEAIL